MKLADQSFDESAKPGDARPEGEPMPWFIREVRTLGSAGPDGVLPMRGPAFAAAPAPDPEAVVTQAPAAVDPRGPPVITRKLLAGSGLAAVIAAAFALGWSIGPAQVREDIVATPPAREIAAPPAPVLAEPVEVASPVAVDSPSERPGVPVAMPPQVRTAIRAVEPAPALAKIDRSADRTVARDATAPRAVAARAPARRVQEVRVAAAPPIDLLATVTTSDTPVAVDTPSADPAPRAKSALPRCKGFQVFRPTSPCTNAPPR